MRGRWILTENEIKETGWFKNSRFQSLNPKPTFLSVITDLIIAYFGIVESVNTYS